MENWEDQPPFTAGAIELNRSCQISLQFAKGFDPSISPHECRASIAVEADDKVRELGYVFPEYSQRMVIVWGTKEHKLCRDCNDELIKMLGGFFG
jgi:hypothetical protein